MTHDQIEGLLILIAVLASAAMLVMISREWKLWDREEAAIVFRSDPPRDSWRRDLMAYAAGKLTLDQMVDRWSGQLKPLRSTMIVDSEKRGHKHEIGSDRTVVVHTGGGKSDAVLDPPKPPTPPPDKIIREGGPRSRWLRPWLSVDAPKPIKGLRITQEDYWSDPDSSGSEQIICTIRCDTYKALEELKKLIEPPPRPKFEAGDWVRTTREGSVDFVHAGRLVRLEFQAGSTENHADVWLAQTEYGSVAIVEDEFIHAIPCEGEWWEKIDCPIHRGTWRGPKRVGSKYLSMAEEVKCGCVVPVNFGKGKP